MNNHTDGITGNTIYVGLGVSGQPKDQPWRWAKSGMAIISFIVGSYLFSRMMRMIGPMKRSSIVLSFVLQAVLCFISAALITAGIVPEKAGSLLPDDFIVLVPLALLSISSGGQIVVSRFLGYGELTSIVLTSAYCDFAFDEKLLTSGLSQNSKRNRRAASAVMMVTGAIAGGFLTKNDDIASAIWIAGALKILVASLFLFWRSEGGIRLE